MRIKYIWNAETDRWVIARPHEARPQLYLIRDEMGATLNHADGGTYTSKRAFTRAVRRAGCEIVGNESMDHIKPEPLHRPREVGEDIKRAYEQHRRR